MDTFDNLLVFKSEQYPNVYIIGTTHNTVDMAVVEFIKSKKFDIVIFEDTMPLVYLSKHMKKIAETYYLDIIINKNIKNINKEAEKIVENHIDIVDESEFTIAVLKESYKQLNSLNSKNNIKVLPLDETIDLAIENEINYQKHIKYLLKNCLISTFNEMQNKSVNLYVDKLYNEMFISQVISVTNTPFYKLQWDDLIIRNKNWAKNLAENILPKNKDKKIVLFCGCMHLNKFMPGNLLSLLQTQHNITFSCDSIEFKVPIDILNEFIIKKNIANGYLQHGDYEDSLVIYQWLFNEYKMYCFCGNDKLVMEYLNVIGNMITIYYKQKNMSQLLFFVNIAKKFIDHFKFNMSELSVGKKIIIAENMLK